MTEHPSSVRSRDLDAEHDLRRALGTLSERQRAVVVLRFFCDLYFCDLTEAETARSLGCSVGAVRTHHARAMQRLRGTDLLTRPDATADPSVDPTQEAR